MEWGQRAINWCLKAELKSRILLYPFEESINNTGSDALGRWAEKIPSTPQEIFDKTTVFSTPPSPEQNVFISEYNK